MHVGVVVGRLEAGQADQRARVARDGVGDLLHQAFGAVGVHRAAHARFAEHRHHGFLGPGADGHSRFQFTGHVGSGAVAQGRRGHAGRQRRQLFELAEAGVNLGIGLLARHRAGARGHVQSPVGINPAFVDGGCPDAGQILGVLQQELFAPKRVLHPRAAEFVQVHTQGEVFDMNALEHGGEPGT